MTRSQRLNRRLLLPIGWAGASNLKEAVPSGPDSLNGYPRSNDRTRRPGKGCPGRCCHQRWILRLNGLRAIDRSEGDTASRIGTSARKTNATRAVDDFIPRGEQ